MDRLDIHLLSFMGLTADLKKFVNVSKVGVVLVAENRCAPENSISPLSLR